MKWVTISEYVDQETGEILDKETVLKHYYIIKKIKKHVRKDTPNGTRGFTTITNVCRQSTQGRLF